MTPEQKLIFDQIPPEEAISRRRSEASRRKQPPNQEIYRVYRLEPLIEKVLEADWRKWEKGTLERRKKQQEIFQAIWGKDVEVPAYLSPSTIAYCLKWVGYEALGYQPTPPTTEGRLVMLMGSAGHWSLLRTIGQQIPGRQETSFTIDEADLSGRIDCLLRNPKTGEYQILELKFVGDYPFRQIKREGLPEHLRSTKNIYQPSAEYRNQVLLYMWAKRKEGLSVACANIIYINRDTGKTKEALVVWNAQAEYDAEQLVVKIKQAKEAIDKKELPEPTVESPYVCGKFCPHRTHCEHGQKFAAVQIRRQQKRRPKWVAKQAKEQAEARRAEMEKLGVVQARFGGWDELLKGN